MHSSGKEASAVNGLLLRLLAVITQKMTNLFVHRLLELYSGQNQSLPLGLAIESQKERSFNDSVQPHPDAVLQMALFSL